MTNTNMFPLRDRESASSLPLFALQTPLGRSNKQTLQHTFFSPLLAPSYLYIFKTLNVFPFVKC